jgi:cystathionine gamma-synthase
MNIETLAIHASREIDPSSGAVSPPINLSTTFERDADGGFRHGYIYSRTGNPNRDALERCLHKLEGGMAAAAFSSGSAAATSVFQALSPNDHVIAPTNVYHGTRVILTELHTRWGLKASFVDTDDITRVLAAVKPETKLIWIETPSNPLLKITDIERISEIARASGAFCVCDNTWATPVLQNPLALGAHLVVHASTKYLGGHSDVLGGVVVSDSDGEFFQRIRTFQSVGGAVPSPFDCWLILRSLPTLPYRIRAQSESALRVARFLNEHRRVTRVHYPGLEGHPNHRVAVQQMKHFGGMLSFEVNGNKDDAMTVAARVRLFTRATSLGGVESLIEHRASVEDAASTTPQNLLRLSIGLENPSDLIDDLMQALQ